MKRACISAIRFYQKHLSPLKASCCRFVPTCSEYAAQAIERYGAVRGMSLAAKRLARCQPLCEGGYDPVPETPDMTIKKG